MSKQGTVNAIDDLMKMLFEHNRQNKVPNKDLRLRDIHILGYIHKNNQVTMSELSKEMNIKPASASQIISGYEKKGWVERVHSSTDRRTVYISVSEKICEEMSTKREETKQKIDSFLDELGEEDTQALERIIRVFEKTMKERS